MITKAYLNELELIKKIIIAYNDLCEDSKLNNNLLDAANAILKSIYENGNIKDYKNNNLNIGEIGFDIHPNHKLINTICDLYGNIYNNGSLRIPFNIDCSKSSNIIIEDKSTSDTKRFVQFLLLKYLIDNPSLKIRCIDVVEGGAFFSDVYNLISNYPNNSTGKIFTKYNEINEVIKDLESASALSMSKLGALYDSVESYNQNNQSKINRYLCIVNVNDSSCEYSDLINQISVLMKNGKKNGISFILVFNQMNYIKFVNDNDIYFSFDENNYIGINKNVSFLDNNISITEELIHTVINKLESSNKVETGYRYYETQLPDYLSMDSSSLLRIPFGVDKDGIIQYFEIGGEAPSHALISGSTGSGKSVALHTLILQIIRNYHPDDVELWAIDYKAVELSSYIDNKTPHFRVIGYDETPEFSYSLLDLLYDEYQKRMKEFLRCNVKNINEYRKKNGKRSMTRIVVIIDEFQILTQAVQEYTGDKDYRTILENLLRLTRAMGISFIFCSQTVATGISGLTDAAKDQIGIRISLKHDDDFEIRSTLVMSSQDDTGTIHKVQNFKRGQCIYKRTRLANEHSPDGKGYEFKENNIFYIDNESKSQIIHKVNELVKNNYVQKNEIFVRGSNRYSIDEKTRHPIEQFRLNYVNEENEELCWYPAAPMSLMDSFSVTLGNESSANILLVGENDDLRESVIFHSVYGFLMQPENNIHMIFFNETFGDRERMINQIQNIGSRRLHLHIGLKEGLNLIKKLKKIRPIDDNRNIYIWYGLDKLKNEIFLAEQDEEETIIETTPSSSDSLDDLMNLLAEMNGNSTAISTSKSNNEDKISYEESAKIIRVAFEVGPENSHHHLVIFNNYKSLKKSGLINLDNFDYRIATKISPNDCYDLFSVTNAMNKVDEDKVYYYSNDGEKCILKPYLFPTEGWIKSMNNSIKQLEEQL